MTHNPLMTLLGNKRLHGPEWFDGPIAWYYSDLHCGGIERQIVATATALKKQHIAVDFLCNGVDPRTANAFFLAGANAAFDHIHQYASSNPEQGSIAKAQEALRAISPHLTADLNLFIARNAAWLASLRPRLLQIWNADNVVTLLAALVAGIPNIVVAAQSLAPDQRHPFGFEGMDESSAFSILGNVFPMQGCCLTANSAAGCESYESWLGLAPGSVRFTPNSFDMEAWPEAGQDSVGKLRSALGIPEQAPVLGGLFRHVAVKDPELWFSAALQACAANPLLHAVVGGDGPLLAGIRDHISKTPFAARFHFPGIVEDVPTFLSMCDVFMHTAHVEGLPNALLEAAAYRLPIVTTACGGAAEIVLHGKSGFVIAERDATVLAKHVGYILAHPGFAAAAGEAGRAHVEQAFSADNATQRLMQVYASLMPGDTALARGAALPAPKRGHIELPTPEHPLVSIVLPTYNHLQFLPAAVESVLGQDYPNFELIIVNDGSTDGTGDWLAGLDHPRVTVIDGPNTRLPTALNRGFAKARGDYLTWVSADNLCLPHFCRLLAGALTAHPQAGFASSAFAFMGEDGLLWQRLQSKVSLARILCRNVGIAAFMYRKDIALQVGEYDPRVEGAEDWDMWLRILEIAQSVHVPYVTYHYRCHKNSMSGTMSDKIRIASTRTAFRALQRMEQRGGIQTLFPQIERCKDKGLALFHANLHLGSSMLLPLSFLKKSAVTYLGAAHELHPDDLGTLGNYAIALAWHDRWDEADALFQRGMQSAPQLFGERRAACLQERKKHAGMYEFNCPLFPTPALQQSELLQKVSDDEPAWPAYPWQVKA